MTGIIQTLSFTGAQSNTDIIVPGVTEIAQFGGSVLDKHVRIVLHEVDLAVSGAATIEFKIGDKIIFSRSVSGAGEVNVIDLNSKVVDDGYAQKSLKINYSASVNVTGSIVWWAEYAGGEVEKSSADVNFGS